LSVETDKKALARYRLEQAGESLDETGFAIFAKYGRIGKAKVYDFKGNRHGKYYEQKRVEVFYAIEGSLMVTVTVYVFYGKWEM